MRQLTILETSIVSGAEHYNVMVVDIVAAAQTFLLFLSLADQDTFRYSAVVTGMAGGTIAGGYLGYVAFGGGVAGGVGALAVGALGTVAGGLACKAAGNFMVGTYNWIVA